MPPATSPLCVTFVVSSAVTVKTIEKLNDSYYKDDALFPPTYTNFFNPVTSDLSQILGPSESPVDFKFDVFEQQSYEELDRFNSTEISKHVQSRGFYCTLTMAILDERSTRDDTVVICYGDETFNRETGEVTGEIMRHWRVSFQDAHELVGMIEACDYGVMDAVAIEKSEQFTNAQGVFEYRKAATPIEGKEDA